MMAERSSQRDNWCKAAPKEQCVHEDSYRTDGMLHGIVMTSDTIKAHALSQQKATDKEPSSLLHGGSIPVAALRPRADAN